MLKKILLGLGSVLVLFLGYIALQPSHFRVAREIAISAPVEKIFPYLNNQKKMNEWNPWTELDPAAKITFSGPDEGVGSRSDWDGGKQLGTGSATITESMPSRIKVKLEYVKPFQMSQDAEYTLTPSGAQTVVSWSVEGENSFLGRVMCTIMNMKKSIGDTFDKGLAKLKTLAEK